MHRLGEHIAGPANDFTENRGVSVGHDFRLYACTAVEIAEQLIGGGLVPFDINVADSITATAKKAITVTAIVLDAGTLVLSDNNSVTIAGTINGSNISASLRALYRHYDLDQ